MRCDVLPIDIRVDTQEPDRLLWFSLRSSMVLVIIFVFFGLWTDMHIPFLGNFSVREIFWMVLMPVAVLTMYLAPLFWRNVCPLATTSLWYHNLFGKRRLEKLGLAANARTGVRGAVYCFLRSRGLVISAILFFAIIPYRLVSFNTDSMASFWLLLAVFGAAAVFGALFPVKSGWCTSLCPVAAAEKAYGMNPAFAAKNTRCHFVDPKSGKLSNCSGCSFNCGDVVEPEHAYWKAESLKVFHDSLNARVRKAFVAMLPGFMFSYFLLASRWVEFPYAEGAARVVVIYGFFLVSMSVSAALYFSTKVLIRKWSFRNDPAVCAPELAAVPGGQGSLDEAACNTRYQLGKHRLDLFFVTLSVNIIWFFASNVLVNIFLARVFGFGTEVGAVIWTAAVFGFFFLSIFGTRSGWNERGPAQYKASWW